MLNHVEDEETYEIAQELADDPFKSARAFSLSQNYQSSNSSAGEINFKQQAWNGRLSRFGFRFIFLFIQSCGCVSCLHFVIKAHQPPCRMLWQVMPIAFQRGNRAEIITACNNDETAELNSSRFAHFWLHQSLHFCFKNP